MDEGTPGVDGAVERERSRHDEIGALLSFCMHPLRSIGAALQLCDLTCDNLNAFMGLCLNAQQPLSVWRYCTKGSLEVRSVLMLPCGTLLLAHARM